MKLLWKAAKRSPDTVVRVLSVTSLDLSQALPADLFRRHARSPKGYKFAEGRRWLFQPPESDLQLSLHRKTRIKRDIKVQGARSPYDGDWAYWGSRLGRHPEVSPRVTKLLKRQKGRCQECGLFFTREDVMEVDHILPKEWDGSNSINNCQPLHRHCHDRKTAREWELCLNRYI